MQSQVNGNKAEESYDKNKFFFDSLITSFHKKKLDDLIANDESKKALNDIFKQILEDYKEYKKEIENVLEEHNKNINSHIHNSFKERVNIRKKLLNFQLNDTIIKEKVETLSNLESKYYDEKTNK